MSSKSLKMERTHWWLGISKWAADYRQYEFLAENLILGVNIDRRSHQQMSIDVSILDYDLASDDWMRRTYAPSISVPDFARAENPRWLSSYRPTSSTGEQILLCVEIDDNKTRCIVIEGQHTIHRSIDLQIVRARAFVGSGERVWAICSNKGKVVVLDSKLQVLVDCSGHEQSRVLQFFIDERGTPTALTSTNVRLHDYRTEILKYRFSETGRELNLERHPTSVSFVDACPSKPNVAIVRHDDDALSCIRWTASGSEFQVVRVGKAGDLNWTIRCVSEKWVFLEKREVVRSVVDPEIQFEFLESNAFNSGHAVKFWASESNPDLVWAIHKKDLFRLRFRQRPQETLVKLTSVSLAESVLASIPDEQSRKWFAAAVANLQQTNHTIKSQKIKQK